MLDAALRAADTGRAMSQENVEIVRRGFDAFNRRDLDAFLALFDPDVEFTAYAMQSELGGRTSSPSIPISEQRSMTFETSET